MFTIYLCTTILICSWRNLRCNWQQILVWSWANITRRWTSSKNDRQATSTPVYRHNRLPLVLLMFIIDRSNLLSIISFLLTYMVIFMQSTLAPSITHDYYMTIV
jgi:hypothetical protein